MKVGFDTGFFIELLKKNPRATSVWTALEHPDNTGIISCLTIFELERLALKGAIKKWPQLGQALEEACQVVWLNRKILLRSSRLSHGLGIPAVDAMILACLIQEGVVCIYTTDRHFETYGNKKVTIENLRGLRT